MYWHCPCAASGAKDVQNVRWT